jgi:hypothetical protein
MRQIRCKGSDKHTIDLGQSTEIWSNYSDGKSLSELERALSHLDLFEIEGTAMLIEQFAKLKSALKMRPNGGASSIR